MHPASEQLFNRYVDAWLDDPLANMWGIPFEQVTDREGLRDLPNLLKIVYKRPLRAFPGQEDFCLQIDSAQFPFLYRGVTGPDHLRIGRLGGGSINTDVHDAARSPPMEKFIREYAKLGEVTGGFQGSREEGVYFTRNPLVALSADLSGPFATPDGILFVVDPSGLQLGSTYLNNIDEATCRRVPVSSIHSAYVNEAIATAMATISPRVETHSFDSQDLTNYRREMLQRLIADTAINPSEALDRRYSSTEAKARMLRGLDRFPELSTAIQPLLGDIFEPSKKPNAVCTLIGTEDNGDIQYQLLVPDIQNFRSGFLSYVNFMRDARTQAGLITNSPALDELEALSLGEQEFHETDRFGRTPMRVITESELDVYCGSNIVAELRADFFD